ncbi:MAG: hypothetical protein ABSA96_09725 [Candidatus Acidiferrales bacterium]|jgi:hypothetical protein
MPDKNKQLDSNVTDAKVRKVRFGAPPRLRRKRRENYDGVERLEFAGHEAIAWFLAVPKELREFKFLEDLARHFNVSRMTTYRWTRDVEVMKRADFLSKQNKMAGNLVARREYESIMEKAVEMAKQGNIAAMKFCIERAFPEDKQQAKSPLSPLSLEESMYQAEKTYLKWSKSMLPTFVKERGDPLAEEGPDPFATVLGEEVEPETGNVNTCDAEGELP